MNGPYASEADALAEPMPREVAALHAAGGVRPGDPDRLVREVRMWHLLDACGEAGVDLGAFDVRVLAWLSGWEDTSVQVVIGTIRRAHAAGLAARTEGEE